MRFLVGDVNREIRNCWASLRDARRLAQTPYNINLCKSALIFGDTSDRILG